MGGRGGGEAGQGEIGRGAKESWAEGWAAGWVEGWSEATAKAISNILSSRSSQLSSELSNIVKKVKSEAWSWPYHAPVSSVDAPSYYTVIKQPMDLYTIEQQIRKGGVYKTKKQLKADLWLMGDNCKLFNPFVEGGENGYWETAVALHRWLVENEFMFRDRTGNVTIGGDR